MTDAQAEDDRAWRNIERFDAVYKLFDAYCEEMQINTFNEDSGQTFSADEVLETLPADSPHAPFIRAFINCLEEIME